MGKVIPLPAPVSPVPAHVRVGPFDYDVDLVDLLDASGRCDFDQLKILVNGRLAEGAQQEILLHEVLHAIFNATGYDVWIGEEATEDAILRLSPVLLEVLRRNPALVDYLTEVEDDDE
jgi:hypothetical protein